MMKILDVTFNGTTDTTGYLFSLMKSLSASLRCGGYRDFADDVVAASGFAFRMWVDGNGLCPSATSIWDFKMQKPWVENCGLTCGYVERLWGEDPVEEERRREAIAMIRKSIDGGCAAVTWDISGCEWGIILGYDDENETFHTLKIDGSRDTVPYEKLGRLELPILSVLTVTGASAKAPDQLLSDTKKLAASHLRGAEWCENAQGLAAYDALTGFVREKLSPETGWNLEYYLGTYGALKWYAWKFFEKYRDAPLAELYQAVYTAWQAAFDCLRSGGINEKDRIAELLQQAKEAENKALSLMTA